MNKLLKLTVKRAVKIIVGVALGLVMIGSLTALQYKWVERQPFATPTFYRTALGGLLWSLGIIDLKAYANYYTHWDMLGPSFVSNRQASTGYECDMQTRRLAVDEYFQTVGDLSGQSKLIAAAQDAGKLYLKINLHKDRDSTYVLAYDEEFKSSYHGGKSDISQKIEGGYADYICLDNVLFSGVYQNRSNYYCRASFLPQSKELRLLDFSSLGQWPRAATLTAGFCREMS